MSKISLSEEEMKLLCDPNWILTKQGIIEKVYTLFGNLSEKMQARLQQHTQYLPQQVLQAPPKISKGEQYERLPYVVLDYPRLFSKENVFAVRSFFWWGHYFSMTLHLKGSFLQQHYSKIVSMAREKKWKGFYFSAAGNEFSFDLDGKDYRHEDGAGLLAHTLTVPPAFLKISGKVSFEHWEKNENMLMEIFERFAAVWQHD